MGLSARQRLSGMSLALTWALRKYRRKGLVPVLGDQYSCVPHTQSIGPYFIPSPVLRMG